jgi:hypothetical protein
VAITSSGFRIKDLIASFYPGFDAADSTFMSGTAVGQGQADLGGGKMVFAIRYAQENLGWYAVFDPYATAPAGSSNPNKQGNIIAARKVGLPGAPQWTKACGIHAIFGIALPGWLRFGCARWLEAGPTTKWGGPYAIKISKVGGGALPSSDTVIQLKPQTINGGGTHYGWVDPNPHTSFEDQVLGEVEVGDRLIDNNTDTDLDYDTTKELMEVTAVDPVAHTITVRRGSNISTSPWMPTGFPPNHTPVPMANTAPRASIPEDSLLYLVPIAHSLVRGVGGGFNWDFVNDPYGQTIVAPAVNGPGNNLVHVNSGDHSTTTVNAVIHYGIGSEYTHRNPEHNSYQASYDIQDLNSQADLNRWPPDKAISLWPAFAGISVTSFPSGLYQSHVRRWQTAATGRFRDYFTDVRAYDGVGGCTTSSTPEPGTTTVYKVNNCGTLNRRHIGTLAMSGDRILRDISSATTGNQITDATPWTYCIATAANECRTGSSAGNIYASVPGKTHNSCLGHPLVYPASQFDLCIGDQGPYTIGPVQWSMEKSDVRGLRGRVLTYFDANPHAQTIFSIAEVMADGKWLIHLGEDYGTSRMYAVRVPPFPEETAQDPLTFERVKVDLYHATAAKFRIEFGYAEHGTTTQYYCTSRREACVVDAEKVVDATPFKWASESSGSVDCASGRCQVEIPRLPGRVVFSRAIFLNAGGDIIETRVLPPM